LCLIFQIGWDHLISSCSKENLDNQEVIKQNLAEKNILKDNSIEKNILDENSCMQKSLEPNPEWRNSRTEESIMQRSTQEQVGRNDGKFLGNLEIK
jgi:hypothetical protein